MAQQNNAQNRPVRTSTASTRARKGGPTMRPFQMPFDNRNMTIIAAGVGTVILGYILMYSSPVMSTMALTISPIILLLGYCVIIPFGILAGGTSKKSEGAA